MSLRENGHGSGRSSTYIQPLNVFERHINAEMRKDLAINTQSDQH